MSTDATTGSPGAGKESQPDAFAMRVLSTGRSARPAPISSGSRLSRRALDRWCHPTKARARRPRPASCGDTAAAAARQTPAHPQGRESQWSSDKDRRKAAEAGSEAFRCRSPHPTAETADKRSPARTLPWASTPIHAGPSHVPGASSEGTSALRGTSLVRLGEPRASADAATPHERIESRRNLPSSITTGHPLLQDPFSTGVGRSSDAEQLNILTCLSIRRTLMAIRLVHRQKHAGYAWAIIRGPRHNRVRNFLSWSRDGAYGTKSWSRILACVHKKKAGATTFIRLAAPAISYRASDFHCPAHLGYQDRARSPSTP